MLSNAYFLAKFRFDTAENELAKNLQNPGKNCQLGNFVNFANLPPHAAAAAELLPLREARRGAPPPRP